MCDPNSPDGVNGPSPDARPFSPVCLSCGFPRKGLGNSITTCPECGVKWARNSSDVVWLNEVRWGLNVIAFGLVAWFALRAISVPIELIGDYARKESLLQMNRCASAVAMLAIWIGTRRLVPIGPRVPEVRVASVAVATLVILFTAQRTGVFSAISQTIFTLTASQSDLHLSLIALWVLSALEIFAGAGLAVILGSLAMNLQVRIRPALSGWLVLGIGFLAGVGRPISQNLHQLWDYFFGTPSARSDQVLRSLVDWYLDVFVTASMLGIVLAICALWLVCSRAASQATAQAAHGHRREHPTS